MFAETFSKVIGKQRGAQRLESGEDSKRKNANIYKGKQKEREQWLQMKIKIRICPFRLLPHLCVLKEGAVQIWNKETMVANQNQDGSSLFPHFAAVASGANPAPASKLKSPHLS